MRRIDVSTSGAIAGAIGAIAMTAWFLIARLLFGIPTPSESFADAVAPLIPVHAFGLLIGIVRGYTPLKIVGFTSVAAAQVIVGAVAGSWFVAHDRSSRFLAGFCVSAWIVTVGAFWSVLGANGAGPSGPVATVMTVGSLAIGVALFGAITAVASAPTRPRPSIEPVKVRTLTRSRLIAIVSVTLAGIGLQRLFSRATFAYDGRTVLGDDVAAITPNDRFYCVTKNVADPDIQRGLWNLTIDGAVGRPMQLDFAALTELAHVEQETTLMCINNEPSGGLMSNALWRGVPLPALVSAAEPHGGIVRVVFHAADDYTDTIPIDKAMQATTLIAYLMNGVALPAEHGFPVRALVPGWFGEKSVKWLRRIELVTEPIEGFYERQGWGPKFVVPSHSRIDAPDFSKPVPLGTTVDVRGVAFCGDRGVGRVDVSDDDGRTWKPARLTSHYRKLAWRLWTFSWHPSRRGVYHLAVRAEDTDGRLQTGNERPAETQGATGYHRIVAHVV